MNLKEYSDFIINKLYEDDKGRIYLRRTQERLSLSGLKYLLECFAKYLPEFVEND